MKLRLPNKLIAAILAAAAPVLYTTLSTATLTAGASFVMGSVAQATEDGVLHVYVLTGQSNSLGTVKTEPLTAAQLAQYGVSADEAQLWNANMHQNSGVLYMPSLAQWDAVQPQKLSANDPFSYMGPEFGFAYMMQKKGWNTATTAEGVDNDIAIVKAALDGGGNKNWQKYVVNGAYVDAVTEGQEYTINPTYQQILDQVKNAVSAAAAKGYSEVNIEGLLYLQGESNGSADQADTHYAKFVENLTADLTAWNETNGLSNVKVTMGNNTVIGQTGKWGSNANEGSMVKMQEYAESTSGTSWIYTRDLDEQTTGDTLNIHYNGDSQLTIGARYAYAFAIQKRENVGMVRNSNYNAALDTADAWWMGNAPTSEDVVRWDLSSVSSISAQTMADNLRPTAGTSANPGNHINESLSVKGIVVEDVYRNRDYSTGTVLIDGGTLNIGSEGILLQGGDLAIESEVHATADQAWNTQNGHTIITKGNLVIDNGTTLTLGDGAALTFHSVTGEGNLVLNNVSLGMSMTDFAACQTAGSAEYSDGDNGFYTGARTIMTLGGNITLQSGAAITGVGALAGANFEISADGHHLTAAAESATDYFIRNGFKTYNTTEASYGATNLVLAAKEGATATLNLATDLKEGVGIRVAGTGNTLRLADGVELSKSSLDLATGSQTKLSGTGMYLLNAANNSGVNLGTGVTIGDDWSGIVMLGATNLGVNVSLNNALLSNAHSYVGLSGATNVPGNNEWKGTITANLYLQNTATDGAAWTWSNGSSGDPQTVIFSGMIAGDGTLEKTGGYYQYFTFKGDISTWTGAFKATNQGTDADKRVTLTFSNSANILNAAILNSTTNGIKMVLTETGNTATDYKFNNTVQLHTLMAGTKNITLGTNEVDDDTVTVGNLSVTNYAAISKLTLGSGTTASFGGNTSIGTLVGNGGTMVVNGGTVTLGENTAITGTLGIDLQSGAVNNLNIGNGGNVTLTQSNSAVWGSVNVADGGTLTLGSGVLTVSGEVAMAEGAKLDVSAAFIKNLVMEGEVSAYKDGANEGNGYAQYEDASFKLIQKQVAAAAETPATNVTGTGLLDGWTLTADANGVTAAGGEFAAGTYYVNTTVDYGKNVTGNTAYTGATELQLHADGAALNLLSNLNPDVCAGGITTKGGATAIAATVNLGSGVELNATDVHRAGTDTISLTGSGTFAMTGINSTGKRYNVESSLPEGLSFGEAWEGTFSLSGNIEQLWLGGAKAGSTVRLDGVTGFMGGSAGDTDNIVAKVEIGERGYTFTTANNGTRAFKGGFSGTGNVVRDNSGNNNSPNLVFASDMSGFTGSIINKRTNGGFTLNFNTGASVVNATSIRNEDTAANMLITMNVNDSTTFNTLVDAGNGKINMNVAADKTATFTKNASLTSLSAASGSVTLSGNTTLSVSGNANVGTLTLGAGTTAEFIGGGELHTVVGNGGNLTLGVPKDNPDGAKWVLNGPIDLGQGSLTAYYNTTDVWLEMSQASVSQCDTVGNRGYTFSEDDGQGHRDGYAQGNFIIVKAADIVNDRSFAPAVTEGDDSGVMSGSSLTVTNLDDGRKGLVLSMDGTHGAYMVNWNVDYATGEQVTEGHHNAYGAHDIVLTTPENTATGQHSILNIKSALESGVSIKSNGGMINLGNGIELNQSALTLVGTSKTTINSNGGTGALLLGGDQTSADSVLTKLDGDGNVKLTSMTTIRGGITTALSGKLIVNDVNTTDTNGGADLLIGTGKANVVDISSFSGIELGAGSKVRYEANGNKTLNNVSLAGNAEFWMYDTNGTGNPVTLAGDTNIGSHTFTISNTWKSTINVEHLVGRGTLALQAPTHEAGFLNVQSLADFTGNISLTSNANAYAVNITTGDKAVNMGALSTQGTGAGALTLNILGEKELTVTSLTQSAGTLNIGNGTAAGNVTVNGAMAGTVNVKTGSTLTLGDNFSAESAILAGEGYVNVLAKAGDTYELSLNGTDGYLTSTVDLSAYKDKVTFNNSLWKINGQVATHASLDSESYILTLSADSTFHVNNVVTKEQVTAPAGGGRAVLVGNGTYVLGSSMAQSGQPWPGNAQISTDPTQWTGVVRLTNVSGMNALFNLNDYANSASWVELNGVSGWDHNWNTDVLTANLILTDNSNNPAWGYSADVGGSVNYMTVGGLVKGEGTFKMTGANNVGVKFTNDISGWTGALTTVATNDGKTHEVQFNDNAKVVNASIDGTGANLKVTTGTDVTFNNTVTATTLSVGSNKKVTLGSNAETGTHGSLTVTGTDATTISNFELGEGTNATFAGDLTVTKLSGSGDIKVGAWFYGNNAADLSAWEGTLNVSDSIGTKDAHRVYLNQTGASDTLNFDITHEGAKQLEIMFGYAVNSQAKAQIMNGSITGSSSGTDKVYVGGDWAPNVYGSSVVFNGVMSNINGIYTWHNDSDVTINNTATVGTICRGENNNNPIHALTLGSHTAEDGTTTYANLTVTGVTRATTITMGTDTTASFVGKVFATTMTVGGAGTTVNLNNIDHTITDLVINDGAVVTAGANQNQWGFNHGATHINGGGKLQLTRKDALGWGGNAAGAITLKGDAATDFDEAKLAVLQLDGNNVVTNTLTLLGDSLVTGASVLETAENNGYRSIVVSGTNNTIETDLGQRRTADTMHLNVAANGELLVTGKLRGATTEANASALYKEGAGTVTFSNDQNILYGYTNAAGTTVMASSATVQNNALKISGGTFEVNAAGKTVNLNSAVNMTGGEFKLTDGTVNVTDDFSVNADSTLNITGGSMVVNGSDKTMTLGSAVAMTGGSFTLTNGTVDQNSTFTATNSTVNINGGVFDTGTEGLTIGNGGTLNLAATSGGSQSFLHGSVTVQNGGQMIVTGHDATGYSGGTTSVQKITVENGGKLLLGMPDVSNQNNETFAGTLVLNGTLDRAAGVSATKRFDLFGGNAQIQVGDNQNGVITNNVELQFRGANTLNVGSGATLTVNGVASSGGESNSVTKTGAGTLILNGTNTFSGNMTVEKGTVLAGSSQALGALNGSSSRKITIKSGATLDVNGKECGESGGYSVTLAGGTLANSGGNAVWDKRNFVTALTVEDADSYVNADTYTYGLIGAGWAATSLTLDGHDLIKTGSNTYMLNRTTVTGTGNLVVREGTIQFRTNRGNGSIASNIVMDGGNVTSDGNDAIFLDGDISVTAQKTGTFSATVNTNAHALTLTGTADLTLSGIISGTGSVVKTGADTITLSATNTYTGGTDVQAGTLVVSNGSSSTLANSMSIARLAELKLTMGGTNATFAIAGAVSGEGDMTIFSGNGNRTYNFTGDLSEWTGNLRQLAGSGSMTLNFSDTTALNANIYNEASASNCFMDVNVKSSMTVNGAIGKAGATAPVRNLTVGADESAEMTASFSKAIVLSEGLTVNTGATASFTNDVTVGTNLKVNDGATASFGADHTLTASHAYAYSGGTLNVAGTTTITALHMEGGKIEVKGGSLTATNMWSNDTSSSLVIDSGTSATVTSNVQFGSEGSEIAIQGTGEFTGAGMVVTKRNGAAADVDASIVHNTGTSAAYYSRNLGDYTISHAQVEITANDSDTMGNLLTDSALINNSGRDINVTNEANTLTAVHAQSGAFTVQNADSSAATLKSIKATGANVTMDGLRQAASLSLNELVIGEGKKVSATNTVAAVQARSADPTNDQVFANIEVTGTQEEHGTINVGMGGTTTGINLAVNTEANHVDYSAIPGNVLDLDGGSLTLSTLHDSSSNRILLSDSMMGQLANNMMIEVMSGIGALTVNGFDFNLSAGETKVVGLASNVFGSQSGIGFGNQNAQVLFRADDNGTGTLLVTPEPTTTALSLLALAALAARRKRK